MTNKSLITLSNNVYTECLCPNIGFAPFDAKPIKFVLKGMLLVVKKLIKTSKIFRAIASETSSKDTNSSLTFKLNLSTIRTTTAKCLVEPLSVDSSINKENF